MLCEASAHIARAELGAHGAFTGLTMRTWVGRPVELATIEKMFAPDMGPFFVATRAISLENTHNFGGGAVTPIDDMRAVREFADDRGVGVHVDGARIWNAHVATGTPLEEYGSVADVLAVCLSKGLGAPVGSLVVGSAAAIDESRVWRKRLGGGMRQVGVLAAAGLHALDHHVERLADDHEHARLLAEACGVEPSDRAHEHRRGRRTRCPCGGGGGAGARRAGLRGRAPGAADGHAPRRHPRADRDRCRRCSARCSA